MHGLAPRTPLSIYLHIPNSCLALLHTARAVDNRRRHNGIRLEGASPGKDGRRLSTNMGIDFEHIAFRIGEVEGSMTPCLVGR